MRILILSLMLTMLMSNPMAHANEVMAAKQKLYPGLFKTENTKTTKRNMYLRRLDQDLLSDVSPEYKIKRHHLNLTKISSSKPKESLTFVFLMNNKSKEPVDPTESTHRRLHLIWTGSKRVVDQPKVVDNEYPVDVSIANYEEGVSTQDQNLILPSKRVKEIGVSWIWAF